MILFEFSPTGYTGSFRATSFVKYLRNFGWEPIIVTVEQDKSFGYLYSNDFYDPNYPQDLKIYRTKVLKKFFINEWGFRWLPYLIPKLIKVIKQEKPDLLFITCPPYYELLAGYLIKKWFGIPYILDYRDGWLIGWSYDDGHFRPRLSIKGHVQDFVVPIYIQSLILKEAERAIFVSDLLRDRYISRFPNLPKNKFQTITNGFDPDDFIPLEPKKNDKFTIVYTGRFHNFRNASPFLMAFKGLSQQAELSNNIQFIHVGPFDNNLMESVKQLKLESFVSFVGMVPHRKALSYIKGADLLLLINGLKESLPGKLFDYLGSQKPILILGLSDGEIYKATKDLGNCFFFENKETNIEFIKKAIQMIYNGKNCNHQSDPEEIKIYDRKYLTGLLSNTFEEILKKK